MSDNRFTNFNDENDRNDGSDVFANTFWRSFTVTMLIIMVIALLLSI